MNLNKYDFYKNRVALNLLAKDIPNAKDVEDVLDGNVFIGVLSKNFENTEAAVKYFREFKKEIKTISVGLGDGDPNQWKMAAEIAAETDPGHVNQVFTTAPYTLGLLKGKGCTRTLVNSLISPSGEVGKVIISTGPHSSQMNTAVVDTKTALGMLKDTGIMSVKFFHMKGLKHIDELKEVAMICAEVGIPVIEPTGGISTDNLYTIVKTCVDAGCEKVIPHVYSSAIDKTTGLTDTSIVRNLYESIKSALNHI